jgi:biotin-(acetyl-CoA carboxylase) ligase
MRTVYVREPAPGPFAGAPVYHTQRTGSTMSDGERLLTGHGLPGLLSLGPPKPGTVVWADYQSAGVGRLPERTWETAAGESCLFTLLLREEDIRFPPGFFPLLAGLALRRVLRRDYGIEARVKWPNDLLVEMGGAFRKISGILCRKKGGWYLLGMGINCRQTVFHGNLAGTAVSVRMMTGRSVFVRELLYAVVVSCGSIFAEAAFPTERVGLNAYLKVEIEHALVSMHEGVIIKRGRPPEEEEFSAYIRGIGKNGELLYTREEGGGTEHLVAGEVSVTRVSR